MSPASSFKSRLPPKGEEEGALCCRDGCCGRIEIKPTENCSCHIMPPCPGCEEAPLWCPECDWHSNEDNNGTN
jgi:hypothetical protein